MTHLSDVLKQRPVNRRRVDKHKKSMAKSIKAYRLRELREGLEVTQVELASRLSLSQNRISRIENGDVDRTQVDTLRRYVEALGGELHIEVEYRGERIEIA